MAPQISEDEIDDLVYFARVGETGDMTELLTSLAEREKVAPAVILMAAKDNGQSTALHMATGNGHLETVRKIVGCFDERPKEEKQAFLDEPNEHGNTGLHWAALGGHLETVKFLVDNGASPALANEHDFVALDMANQNDKKEVAQYFLSFLPKLENENTENGLGDATASIQIEDTTEDAEEPSGSS
ncbi:Putative Ankyrin repeat-containing YAR1 [[Torrubiella] hemipterigena]|uniref:Putative Ankyrin repeat-containing YAR1 n=1 Tax=[Torrubiella] hemipterigena TaxID=1531966 RepID=A0A0A1TH32_9HYPO|nr:Putative Ankyrin repeat-containing YAR1 [[Torrubiella] hemipterigena]